jgi:hypothetical protein
VGYGDIYPIHWFGQIIVIIQAMLSVVYTVVIFTQGMSHLGGKLARLQPSRPTQNEQSSVSIQ